MRLELGLFPAAYNVGFMKPMEVRLDENRNALTREMNPANTGAEQEVPKSVDVYPAMTT